MKTRIHSPMTFVACLAVLALSPALGFAGNAAKVHQQHGFVKSVDMQAHTLVMSGEKQKDRVFTWDDHTKFSAHGKSAGAEALKVGEQVRLDFASSGGTSILRNVHISPGKSGKTSPDNNSATKGSGS